MMRFKDKETMNLLTGHYEKVKGNIKMHRDIPFTFQRVNIETLEYEHFGFWNETSRMIQEGSLIFERR